MGIKEKIVKQRHTYTFVAFAGRSADIAAINVVQWGALVGRFVGRGPCLNRGTK